MANKQKNIILISTIFGLSIAGFFIYLDKRKATQFAKLLVGQTEISGNMGFSSPAFQKLMEGVNWNTGDQWCIYFAKVVWVNKYPDIKNLLMKLISGNSQVTFSNFVNDKSGLFEVSSIPRPNDIVIWQYVNPSTGKAEQRGHGGIVSKVKSSGEFYTVEGNTNESGGREGYIVAEKTHNISEFNKSSGLRLKGFIHYKYA
jgi:hypothetical protein